MATRAQLIFLGILLVLVVAALLWVFFSLPDGESVAPVEETFPEATPVLPPEAVAPPEAYRIYLVLDDAGHTLEDLRQFLPFSGTFTVAVLPGLPFSGESARISRTLGHEVLLHQPMEPLSTLDPGPGAIFSGDSADRIREILGQNLDSLGHVAGVNNHMGSRVTAETDAMAEVLQFLQEKELFFLDSRTTPESVVEAVARDLEIPVLVRDVFLDNERTHAAIREQLQIALEIAREAGEVIAIGHVTSPELAEVLLAMDEEITAAGFVFLPVTAAFQRRSIGAGSWN